MLGARAREGHVGAATALLRELRATPDVSAGADELARLRRLHRKVEAAQ